MSDVQIPLSPAAQRAFAKPVVGKGGHQTLLRRLQQQISPEGVMTISVADMEKMLRYLLQYGKGGFQQRLAAATGRRVPKAKNRNKKR